MRRCSARRGRGVTIAVTAAAQSRQGEREPSHVQQRGTTHINVRWVRLRLCRIGLRARFVLALAYSIAAIETLLALALIFGFARKTTYILTAVVCMGIWTVAEGFGGPYTSTSTDIGAAVMYAVVAAALLVLSLQCGPSRYSVDHYIEKRVNWWHWVAEFGAHNHPAPSQRAPAPISPPARTATTAT